MRLFNISVSGRGQESKDAWRFLDWYCRRYRKVVEEVLHKVLEEKIYFGTTMTKAKLQRELEEAMKKERE